ncbi:substrate-binding domain-containing protein [Candidatus Pelagibacter sp.]|jgi:phosphate transport system substrate-binding protein|nr:substrate-binding domain-containing protein [Candidatus Pelagibacter sp.]|tara:strand:+ start:945 stop:2000 length:1056 start_codon:yes stop_codon:yes gene_type:complete
MNESKQGENMNRLLKLMLGFLIVFSFATNSYSRDQIKIVGSSTVYPYATVVAEKFGKGGKFKTPVIESTGTGGGMKLFCAGVGANHPDITNASRAIKPKEKTLCEKNGVTDIIEIVVGNDGISFAHSVNSPDADFTKEQLWRALAAKVDVDGKLVENPYKKWSDIDSSLPNKKIEILVAPPTSGTRDAWNSLVMAKGCTKTAKSIYEADGKKAKKECVKIREDGYAVEAGENDTLIVQKLTSNPDAYGFFGYSYLVANKDKIKASAVNGVKPSLQGIQDYSYPIARPLFFYVKKAHVGVIPGIEEFLKEFTSKKAMSNRGYLAQIGLVPLASDKYQSTRTAALELITINLN